MGLNKKEHCQLGTPPDSAERDGQPGTWHCHMAPHAGHSPRAAGLTWWSSTASLLYSWRVCIPSPRTRTQLAKPGLHTHTLVTSSNGRDQLSLSVSHGGEQVTPFLGFPGGTGGNPPASAGDIRDIGSIPESGRFPWRRAWQPTPVFFPEESHGQRSLAGYSPWDRQEWDKTEAT